MNKYHLEKQVTETAKEARQGLLGRPMLFVLLGGLLLALAAWGLVELYGENIDRDPVTSGQATPNQTGAPSGAGTDTPNSTSAPTNQNPAPQTGTGGETQGQ